MHMITDVQTYKHTHEQKRTHTYSIYIVHTYIRDLHTYTFIDTYLHTRTQVQKVDNILHLGPLNHQKNFSAQLHRETMAHATPFFTIPYTDKILKIAF